MSRILTQHFASAAEKLDKYFEHSGLASHSDVIGLAREGFVKLFLEGNLPTVVSYLTGQIIDHEDTRSKQVDIILQSAFSPRMQLFGDINIAFSDYVLGAIEVKSTLTTASDWEKKSEPRNVLNASRSIKALKRRHFPSARPNKAKTTIQLSTPYVLFAYKGPTAETLCEKLINYRDTNNIEFEDFLPDIITVLDRRYTLVRNNGWVYVKEDESLYKKASGDDNLLDLFMFVTRTIEAWNSTAHPTDFRDYLLSDEQKRNIKHVT